MKLDPELCLRLATECYAEARRISLTEFPDHMIQSMQSLSERTAAIAEQLEAAAGLGSRVAVPEVEQLSPEGVAPPCVLLVMCSECGLGLEAPLPLDRDQLARALALGGWFVAILTPPGHVPILLGALCGDCAPRAFTPEVLRAAEERRQKLLQGEKP